MVNIHMCHNSPMASSARDTKPRVGPGTQSSPISFSKMSSVTKLVARQWSDWTSIVATAPVCQKAWEGKSCV